MKLKFSTKMMVMFVAWNLMLGASLSAFSLYLQWKATDAAAQDSLTELRGNFDKSARNQVENAVSMLQSVYNRSQKGEISLEVAKKTGADLLRNLKYGKDGYFWADTTEGVNVVLLGTPVEGTNRFNKKDAKGKYNIQAILKAGMQPGGGFSDYYTTKKDSTIPCPKRSYSLLFQPFGWVIGTGNYIDDIKPILAREHAELKNETILFASILLFLSIASVVASIFFTKFMVKDLGGEPEMIASLASRIAGGDLRLSQDASVPATGIHAAMITMSTRLQDIIGGSTKLANSVAQESNELHDRISQMASGAEETASQAVTASAASEEMAATSADIARNCHIAAQGAEQAGAKARTGAEVVQQTILGMESIASQVKEAALSVRGLGSRSEQIGEIIGTIEDIADQTNLLALNAAIEAARAGDQGRGFAVVADEVRALADRTSRATKEIGAMIKTIQKETLLAVSAMEDGVTRVELGTSGAEESGKALQDILRGIEALTMQVKQIATAAEEQTATTSEITQNMQQITDLAHKTSGLAGSSVQATTRLDQVARELQALISHFSY